MTTLALTRELFDAAVASHPLLVVQFVPGSAWPMADLAQRFPDVAFAHVDPERDPMVAALFGLGPEPALLIFRERIVLYLEKGVHAPERVEALLAQVRALDMDQVRAAIEEEKRAEVALRMRRVCPTARRGQLGQ
jgi:thioredoxin 1